MVIISRAEANAKGLPRYFTGKPCPKGHIDERFTANGTCRPCSNAMSVRAQAKDVERRRAHNAKWRKANPERHAAWAKQNKEARRAILARYYEANKDKAYAYYAANAATIKQRIKDWVRDNPEKVTAYRSQRRALEANAEGRYTGEEIKTLYRLQRGRCAYCEASLKTGYHADHIQPLSRGGTNWISNIQLTCPTCNIRKSAMEPTAFAARWGRLL